MANVLPNMHEHDNCIVWVASHFPQYFLSFAQGLELIRVFTTELTSSESKQKHEKDIVYRIFSSTVLNSSTSKVQIHKACF